MTDLKFNFSDLIAPTTIGAIAKSLQEFQKNFANIATQAMKPYLDAVELQKKSQTQLVSSLMPNFNVAIKELNSNLANSMKFLVSGLSFNMNEVLINVALKNVALNLQVPKIDLSKIILPNFNQQFKAITDATATVSNLLGSDLFQTYFKQLQDLSKAAEKQNKDFDFNYIDEIIEKEKFELVNSFVNLELSNEDQKFLEENSLSDIIVDENYDLNLIQNNQKLSIPFKNYLIEIKEYCIKWYNIKRILFVIFSVISASSDTITLHEFFNKEPNQIINIYNNEIIDKFDYYVCSVSLSVRSHPKSKANKICNIYKDTKVKIIKNIPNWCLIEFSRIEKDYSVTQSGWVSKRSLKKLSQ